jgi:amino acid adenylation domain-containing protein
VLPGWSEHVAQAPKALAVRDRQGSLTYQELERAATRLARRLQAAGAGPGERVALCLDRNRNLLVGILAALKSGAAYVPVDIRHPSDRVDMMLQDADVKVVLTEPHLERRLHVPPGAKVLFVEAAEPGVEDRSCELPGNLAAQTPAYLIYTSGSTGRPKGVEISRGALANFLRSMQHTPGISSSDRLLSITTVAFDIAGLELLLPLASGACVYIAPNDVVADARALSGLMVAYRPTIMQATPATWRMLLDTRWKGDTRLKVLCGGEALARELARQLLPRCESLWNMYGPTETTIWSSVYRVTEGDLPTVPIGTPIDATSIYILDGNKELVPRGVSGEIYIGGAGVANGYFRNPELTRERFVADPFAGTTDARMYRTGDAGRWLRDGTLEYLGRLDHQIKLRGFRIEPAEIEVAIKASGRVRDALVVARALPSGDNRLVAYCLVAPAQLTDAGLSGELSEALSRKLPSYMVPSAFVPLAQFPQTSNGKIDRSALPLPALDRAAIDAPYLAPRDAIEVKLQALWQDILGVRRVGVRDNFFSLGGHSLLATRLFAAIERTFDVQLQLSVLFERSTIEYLAESIRAKRGIPASRALLGSAPLAGLSVSASLQPVFQATKFLHLVPIQEQGTRPRLFCVHGAGGQVLNFWTLSRQLGSDQPFYGLQAPGVDGRQNPYSDIQEMATVYLEELIALQPRGPYYLSGYCGGGWIAFEMANRLRRAGENVAFLALLDAYGPHMRRDDPRLEKWVQGTLREGPGFLVRKMQARLKRDYEAVSQTVRIKYHRWLDGVVPYDLRDTWLTQAFLNAAAGYRPAPYDGKVTLLLAQDVVAPADADESQFGWTGLMPAGLQIIQVPGTHFTLTEYPNVVALAATLARCMDDAETAAG